MEFIRFVNGLPLKQTILTGITPSLILSLPEKLLSCPVVPDIFGRWLPKSLAMLYLWEA